MLGGSTQKRQEIKHEIRKDSAPLNICELTPKLITALLLEDKMTKARLQSGLIEA